MAKKVYVIAGEASGDLYGADLIRSLRAESREPLEIHGVGGDRIRNTGALDFFDLAHFHVTGITDALKRLPDYKRAEKIILAQFERAKPDVAVLIDNPGFNLHLAPRLRAMGVPLVYYIAPQVWAWAPERVRKIARYFSKVLVVFEFEKAIYEREGIPVEWVGHPLKDVLRDIRPAPRERGKRLVSLLPGSRKGEIKMLFDAFLGAAKTLSRGMADLTFALIKAPTIPRAVYERLIRKARMDLRLVEQDPYGTIASSDLAIVCSGTATLECALLGVPMVISNRGTLLTYLIARALIRVPYLGLPNLILGRKSIPELLQFDATPRRLAAEARRLLGDGPARARMGADLAEVSRRLGEPGATRRAAAEVLKVLDRHPAANPLQKV